MAIAPLTPRLVIFDLDGTLGVLPVDWYGLKKTLEDDVRTTTGSAASFSYWSGIQLLKQKLGTEGLNKAYAIIQQYEGKGAAEFVPNESAIDYLKTVAARGGVVAICTNNMTSTVTVVLERLGLRSHVSCVVGMDSVSRPKPDPEGLALILKTLKITGEEALFIGDAESDRDSARAAAIRFVAVDSPEFGRLR